MGTDVPEGDGAAARALLRPSFTDGQRLAPADVPAFLGVLAVAIGADVWRPGDRPRPVGFLVAFRSAFVFRETSYSHVVARSECRREQSHSDAGPHVVSVVADDLQMRLFSFKRRRN